MIGKGNLPIVKVELALGVDIDEAEVDSIGGWILQTLGDLPAEDQRIEFERFTFVVRTTNGPWIMLVQVFPKAEEEPED